MTVEELQIALDKLPRFAGGTSFVIINGKTDPDGVHLFVADPNPDAHEPYEMFTDAQGLVDELRKRLEGLPPEAPAKPIVALTLSELVAEFRQSGGRNEVAFVSGMASLGCWLADFPEAEWPKRLDALMKDVGHFKPGRKGCAACDRGDFQLGHSDWCPKAKG